jgi:hypothetical protein
VNAPAGGPLVTSSLVPPVVDHQLRRPQHDPHLAADQPHRHRVAVHPHGDLAVAVDPGRQQQPGLERLVRHRDQQRHLGRGDPRVQLRQGVHFRDRDQVVAAEVADLALDAALLVRALDAGLAVERANR